MSASCPQGSLPRQLFGRSVFGSLELVSALCSDLGGHVLRLAGTRGATSAEYFLSHDYAVIFLHRQHSLLPFSRHYSHSTRPFLDLLRLKPSSDPSVPAEITVDSSEIARMLPILQKHHEAHDQGTLITIPFVTVNEYLWLLKAISEVMGGDQGVGREGLFYLACAVSDFFLPSEKMVRPSYYAVFLPSQLTEAACDID